MRKLLSVLMLATVLAVPAIAQSNDDTIVVKKSDLTSQQLATAQAANTANAVKNGVGSWSGIGHEVGTAVNEGLSAVTVQANNFANTKVGKWTMALVIFKVAGAGLVGLIISLSLLGVGIPTWIFIFYRNCVKRTVKISETKEGLKTWKIVNDDNAGGETVVYAVVLIIFIGICTWIGLGPIL